MMDTTEWRMERGIGLAQTALGCLRVNHIGSNEEFAKLSDEALTSVLNHCIVLAQFQPDEQKIVLEEVRQLLNQ